MTLNLNPYCVTQAEFDDPAASAELQTIIHRDYGYDERFGDFRINILLNKLYKLTIELDDCNIITDRNGQWYWVCKVDILDSPYYIKLTKKIDDGRVKLIIYAVDRYMISDRFIAIAGDLGILIGLAAKSPTYDYVLK
jgi:hypothetical protein